MSSNKNYHSFNINIKTTSQNFSNIQITFKKSKNNPNY